MSSPKESWFVKYWRPAMAWQYFSVCLFDFMFAPILSAVYATINEVSMTPWHPLTLEGGGLYHIAMGTVLGITAWTRGQVQIQSVKNYTNENV